MSYLGRWIINKMPQNLKDSKLHQSLCETWCFSGLVVEKCFSYALILYYEIRHYILFITYLKTFCAKS